MPCPFCSGSNHNDGAACCDLNGDNVDNEIQQKYCFSDGQYYEKCPTYESAEVLTESICNEIIRSFSEAVCDTQEGFCAFTELVTELAKDCDYLPLHDACRILEYPPQIPKCGSTYTDLVRTDQERELAQALDDALENMLDSLRLSIPYGSGGGDYPCVSPSQIFDTSYQADKYGSLMAECMENLRISVKPEKYAKPAEELAAESGAALRRRLLEVVTAINQAARDLEEGMRRTEGAADSGGGWILRDAGISWEVD